MSEGLSRKRRVRGGHRGSATRMLQEVYDTIESTVDRDSIVTRLEQCKISLEEKLEIIKQQDEEILVMVEDEEVEHEIEEADNFSGRVRRAIIEATCVIEGRRMTPSPAMSANVITSPTTSTEASLAFTSTSTSSHGYSAISNRYPSD